MTTKLCPKCNTKKPIECFSLTRKTSEARQYVCKDCANKWRSDVDKKMRSLGIMTYSQRTNRRLRLQVLQAYGGKNPKCACCKEREIEFLSIDHKDGKGSEHRRQIKAQGTGFYHWLRRNNYPGGFQILCHNCNQAKGHFGYCPHKTIGPFLPPPRLHALPMEIKQRITKALSILKRPTIEQVSKASRVTLTTVQRYRAMFIESGAWKSPIRKRTHCFKGHKFVNETTAWHTDGTKHCLICAADNYRRKHVPKTPAAAAKSEAKRKYWASIPKAKRRELLKNMINKRRETSP